MDFTGKAAILTGGAQGIGKAISTTLLKAGMKVLVCDIDESAAKSFLQEIPANLKPNVIFQKCDVSSFDEFKAAFEKAKSTYGKIDLVINNAGTVNERHWKKMIEVNFVGVIHGIQLGFEYMGKNNGGSGGHIINTASDAGLYGLDLSPVYSGTKHGVVGLTKSFGQPYHFEKTGVTVNAVCPGPADTRLFHGFSRLALDKEKADQLISQLKPISPNEVAKAVMKLLQDGRNGALLRVEGFEGARIKGEGGIRYVE